VAKNDPITAINKILGLNNVRAPDELERGEMTKLENVDVTDANHARQRPGQRQVRAQACHSVGGSSRDVLMVSGGVLMSVDATTDEALPVTTLTDPDAPMSYASHRGVVYFSNGIDRGAAHKHQLLDWGQVPPSGEPTLTQRLGGALYPGQYRVCVTALSPTGEESPPTRIGTTTLPETGAVEVSNIQTPAGATWLRVYATTVDGTALLLATAVPAGTTTVTIMNEPRGLELSTYGQVAIPAGQVIAYYRGRMLSAVDRVLWWSQPYNLGLVDPSSNFVQFPGRIVSLMPVHEGVVVCYDGGVTYLQGTDPAQFVWYDRGVSQAIPGTEAQIPSDRFGSEPGGVEDDSWVWLSDQGFMAATHEGEVLDLLGGRVDVDAGPHGAGVFDFREGAAMYRGTIRNPADDGSSFGFTDRATAEVYRNGVLI